MACGNTAGSSFAPGGGTFGAVGATNLILGQQPAAGGNGYASGASAVSGTSLGVGSSGQGGFGPAPALGGGDAKGSRGEALAPE